MKKILITTIALLTVLGTTGCNSKLDTTKTDNSNTNVEEKQETKTEKTISMGEWNNNTYTNDFLDMTYNLPEGWSYSSEEEIADLMSIGIEALNDDQKKAAKLAELTSVYYLVANNPNTAESVMLMSEKTSFNVTTDYYLNQVQKQLEAVESIKYQIGEKSTKKIGNKEFTTVTVTATQSGVTLMQRYYVYKMDKYFVSIISTSTTGEETLDNQVSTFNFN